MERGFVGIGSNVPLGDQSPEQLVRAAIQAIAATAQIQLLAQSSLYCSKPIGATGPDYINAVVAISTDLAAMPLLTALQAIEQQFERQRPYKNAPRTLDLDLLLLGNQQITSLRLTLPHPALSQRAFVVQPLFELAPNLTLPGLGSIAQWLVQTEQQAIKKIN
jgi:2-amino-4-hydroxy-6-hydroxymethyldihydropteridine diphosphokinase